MPGEGSTSGQPKENPADCLRTRAADIPEEAARERFLRRVPENARTLALARERWGEEEAAWPEPRPGGSPAGARQRAVAVRGDLMRAPLPRETLLLLAVLQSLACHHALSGGKRESAPVPEPSSERTLLQGRVVGVADEHDTHGWLGIPYAAPPVGERRWRAPVPHAPWEGVREATRFGSQCVQIGGGAGNVPREQYGKVVGSEDCLTLNLWAPRFEPGAVPSGADRLPVMLWIHGGGNSAGTAATYPMVRNLVGRHRVLVVTVNYRLGVLGWFHHPALHGEDSTPEDRSGNYGTLDLLLALEWVRDNISAFGGDPGNVTIFGESAGGMNVFSLLVSPKARGLFHRAISQSGLPFSASLAEAHHLVDDTEPGRPGSSGEVLVQLLRSEGLARDRAEAKARLARMSAQELARYLRSKSPQELLSPFQAAAFGMYESPTLLRDGAVLPLEPFAQVLADASRYNAVPTLLGTNRDEMKLFMVGDPRHVSNLFGVIPQIRDVAAYNREAAYLSDSWKALGADLPAERMRAAQGASVYVYRFDWDEAPTRWPVDLSVLLGAAHALEIPFVLLAPEAGPFGEVSEENLAGRRELSEAMASYWAEFARSGAPGRGREGRLVEWRPWEAGSPSSERMMIFDTPAGGGLRMSSQGVTLEALLARLERDPAYQQSPRERCGMLARLFAFPLATAHWRREDFQRVGAGMCRDYSLEQLRSGTFQ